MDEMEVLLRRGLGDLGLPETAAPAMARYGALLLETNQVMNLTAITDPADVAALHFLDSAALLTLTDFKEKSVADVGTGAGFPGIVAKLYKPQLALTLMEPTGKRVDFLRYVCGQLGLEAEFVKERAEEAARKRWREAFDVASARAVAALPVLLEYCLPLVKKGGLFIAMKGAGAAQEAQQAQAAAAKLGGRYAGRRDFTLPDGSARSLLFYEKISQTPPVYPRNGGKIAKAPLK